MIVYTAIFGNTDPLHEPAVMGPHRYICLTDQPIESDCWEIVRVEPQERPARQSRLVKWSPPFPDWDVCLWIDACFTLRVDPQVIADHHPEDLVNFRHRDRTRIIDEAEEIIRLGKAREIDVLKQLDCYQKDGFDTAANPQHSLSCNGMLLMRNTEEFRRFSDLITEQLQVHTARDQMATDYCAWKTGLEIGKFPGTFDRNPYTRHRHYNRPVNDY